MAKQGAINWCSATWYRTFLDSIPAEQTESEVGFVRRQLPRDAYERVLDVCCGPGRHALALARQGYAVVGVDRDEASTRRAAARARAEGLERAVFVRGDMRALPLAGEWDAALNLWASFGYFDGATNEGILRAVAERLRPGGRFILDVYHRGFFERNGGERAQERAGERFLERKQVVADRLHVELTYASGQTDRFEWQVWTPVELSALAQRAGFVTLLACAGYDEAVVASPEQPRMQFVFRKDG